MKRHMALVSMDYTPTGTLNYIFLMKRHLALVSI
jgi:hypothetical protein